MSSVSHTGTNVWQSSLPEAILILLTASCLVALSACGGESDGGTAAIPLVESEDLISLLQTGDPDQRIESAKALHRFPGSSTVTALIDALQDEDPRVRKMAALSLGRLRDALAVDALIELLSDDEEDVAVAATGALGLIGHPAAVEPLFALLDNGSPAIAEDAIIALGRIGTPDVATGLLKEAGKSSPDRMPLFQDSLTMMGEAALEPLLTALAEENDTVAGLAADSLLVMGEEGIELLLKGLNGDSLVLSQRAARALGRSGEFIAIQPLIRALGDRELHTAALTAIIAIGEKADDDLIEALLADNPLIRRGAAEALGSLGITRAVPYLFELINDPDREVRTAAQAAINRIDEIQ